MSTLEEIERQIMALPREELARLCRWIAELDADLWDAQIEADIRAGRLDDLGERAREAHAEGKCTDL